MINLFPLTWLLVTRPNCQRWRIPRPRPFYSICFGPSWLSCSWLGLGLFPFGSVVHMSRSRLCRTHINVEPTPLWLSHGGVWISFSSMIILEFLKLIMLKALGPVYTYLVVQSGFHLDQVSLQVGSFFVYLFLAGWWLRILNRKR